MSRRKSELPVKWNVYCVSWKKDLAPLTPITTHTKNKSFRSSEQSLKWVRMGDSKWTIPELVSPGCRRKSTIYWPLIQNTLYLCKTLFQPSRLLTFNWCYNCDFKHPCTFFRVISFRIAKTIARPMNLITMGHCHLFGYDVNLLARSNTVWNTMTVDNALCNDAHGSFGRSTMCGKGKSITRTHIFPFSDRRGLSVVKLTPSY